MNTSATESKDGYLKLLLSLTLTVTDSAKCMMVNRNCLLILSFMRFILSNIFSN